MEEDRRETTVSILHLTLEIIYLLTGEGYVVAKKGLNSAPRSAIPERSSALKIQELTNKMIELLTREVCRYMEQCRDLCSAPPADHSPPSLDASDESRPIKSESHNCEQGNPRKAGADPSLAPSPLFKEELRPDEGGDAGLSPLAVYIHSTLVNRGAIDHTHQDHLPLIMEGSHLDDQSHTSFTDLSSPTGHMQPPLPFIKGEPPLRIDEDLPYNDLEYSAVTVKEEPFFSEGFLRDPGCAASSHPTQYTPIIVKGESFSSDKDNLPDTPVLGLTTGNETTDSGEEGNMDTLSHSGYTPSQGMRPTLTRPGEITAQTVSHNSDLDCRTSNVHPPPIAVPTFKCHKCGECFSSKRDLDEHRVVHKAKKPHVCSHCGKSFSYQSQLLIHERTHTGEKPFTCADCGKCFNQLVHLGIHQMSHTGEKPFTCSECGKSFNRKTVLTIHQRVHTGEKPFYCADCGKYFSTSSNLIKHQRVHTGEKPYACPDCGELFIHYTQLIRHQASQLSQKSEVAAQHCKVGAADASEESRPIKSESHSCEQGNPRKAGANPSVTPSPLFKEELQLGEEGDAGRSPIAVNKHSALVKGEPQNKGAIDTDHTHQDHLPLIMGGSYLDDQSQASFMDLSSPTGHTQHPLPLIKEEPPLHADEDLPHNDLEYSAVTIKEEPFFSEGFLRGPGCAAPSHPTQYTPIIVKGELFSSDEDNLPDTPVLGPTTGNETTDSGEEDNMDTLSPSGYSPSQDTCPTLTRPAQTVGHNCDPDCRTSNIHLPPIAAPTFKCHECGECFTSKWDLDEHHVVHKAKKPHVCSHCGKSFSYQSQLLIHERTHTGEKPFTCADCGKCFNQLVHLGIHQMSHTGEKPFTCSECGKSFNRKTTLTIHQRVHTGEKPFYCADCGKYFSTSSNLIKHQRVHTGEKPYACPDCGELFVHYTQLIRHQASHTQPEPAAEKTFSCSECGECFTQKSQHLKHERTHKDGSSGFPCAVCGQCFKQHKRFLSHQCIQDGRESFECSDYERVPGTEKKAFLL